MPPADQMPNSLREVANTWKIVSILWHIYFGVFVVALAFRFRPSKRITGILLGLPFLSVSAFAWLSSNPFNGTVFTLVSIALLLAAAKLLRDSVQVASLWSLIAGVLLFLFGWIYPRFLDTSSYLPYLYAAPIGIIPCPTLIIAIGSVLILDGLGSHRLNTVLGLAGLLYGIMGVAYLHIALDWALILGACFTLIYSSRTKWGPQGISNA
jgi:hypothetical protein